MNTDAFPPLVKRWWPGALLVVLVLLVWGQSVSFQFVWDDKFFIEDLQSIRSLRSVPEMFYSLDAQSSYPQGFVLFRPLRTLHYAVLFTLGGGGAPKPWLFHLANIAWHAAASVVDLSIVSQEVTIDRGAGVADFSVTFNRPPSFVAAQPDVGRGLRQERTVSAAVPER